MAMNRNVEGKTKRTDLEVVVRRPYLDDKWRDLDLYADKKELYDELETGCGIFAFRDVTRVDEKWKGSIQDLSGNKFVKALLDFAAPGETFEIAGYHCLYISPRSKTRQSVDEWCLAHNEYLGYDVTHLGGGKNVKWELQHEDSTHGIGTGKMFTMHLNGNDIVVSNARLKKTNLQRPEFDITKGNVKDAVTENVIHIEYGPLENPSLRLGNEGTKDDPLDIR